MLTLVSRASILCRMFTFYFKVYDTCVQILSLSSSSWLFYDSVLMNGAHEYIIKEYFHQQWLQTKRVVAHVYFFILFYFFFFVREKPLVLKTFNCTVYIVYKRLGTTSAQWSEVICTIITIIMRP